jgi:hypothetical protein
MSALVETEKMALQGVTRVGQSGSGGGEGGNVDESTRQDLLFARLSPLLILKLLPKEAFALEGQGSRDGAVDRAVDRVGSQDVHGAKEIWDCGQGDWGGSKREEVNGSDDEDGNADEDGVVELGKGAMERSVGQILKHVKARLFSVVEFKPVREVAAEVFGRMPPHLTCPLLLRSLENVCLASAGKGEEHLGREWVVFQEEEDAARTAVLVLCFAVGSHGLMDCFRGTIRMVQRLLVEGSRPPCAGVVNSGDGREGGSTSRPGHLQDGCVAALSAAIAGHLAQASAAALSISNKTSTCPVLGSRGLLEFVCRALCRQEVFLLPDTPKASASSAPPQIGSNCDSTREAAWDMAAVQETLTVRDEAMLELRASHMLATAARALPPNSEALRVFSKAVTPTCLQLSSGRTQKGGRGVPGVGVRQVAMHVLFIIVHGLGERSGPLLPDVLAIADDALTAKEGELRLAALKLLGAAATASEEQFVSDEARLERVHRSLIGMANLDDHAEVRSLAAKLAQLIFPES